MTAPAISHRMLLPPATVFPLITLAASVGLLGGAFAFQFLGGLAPCELCIYQRYPYGVTIVLGTMGLAFARTPAHRHYLRLSLGISALAFAIGGGTALYHTGIEQKWWLGPQGCTTGSGGADTSAALLAQIMESPTVFCDVIPWSLFGISMAGYNTLASAGLVAVCLIGLRIIGKPGSAS